MKSNYEELRSALFADMAALFEFFSYDIQSILERCIQAARNIQDFEEYAFVVQNSSGEIRTYLSDGVKLPKKDVYELSDFYPGESALYIVDDVTDKTQNILFHAEGAIRSYAIIPLITQNEVIGLLIPASSRVAAFEEDAQDLFFSLGSYLAVAVENIRHYERSQERLKVLISLTESRNAIAAAVDLDRILAKVAEEGLKTLGVMSIAIYLRDETAGAWERRVVKSKIPTALGPARVMLQDLPREISSAISKLEIHFISGAAVESLGSFKFSPRFGTAVIVPLRIAETTSGFILMETTKIDGERQYLIQLFSGQVQGIFSNAMLVKGLTEKTSELERSHKLVREFADDLQKSNEMLERRVKELSTLHDVNAVLVSKTDVNETLHFILDQACTVMKADKGSLLLLDGDILTARCTRGIEAGWDLKFKLGEGVAGWVAKIGQPRIIENIQADPLFRHKPGGVAREETMLAVPLAIDGKVIGVLNVDREVKYGVFSSDEERLLMSLAMTAARAVDKARLFDDLRDLHHETLEAFAQAVDTKDAYTHGHSRRVSYLSVLVARMLRLTGDEIEIIGRASLLHDIGKIGISNSVLFKPGRLTDEEYEMMKTHVIFGENILKPIKRMAAEAKIVRHHHERWDGRGYPDGLKGEEIPIGSAIIGVTDAYDTMTSDRPYRKSLGKEVAKEELHRCAGTQFNPLVVGAFMMVASRDDFNMEDLDLHAAMQDFKAT